jgi:hypothetical protein
MVNRVSYWRTSLRAAAMVSLLVLPGLLLGLTCQRALVVWLAGR